MSRIYNVDEPSSPCTSSYVNLRVTEGFDFDFRNISAGQIFNTLEESILDAKWDVRESEDYQTILLARNHMFYTVNDYEDLKYYYDYEYKEVKNSENLILNIDDEKKKEVKNPLDFFQRVNSFNINELFDTSLYDYGTINYYFNKEESDRNNLTEAQKITEQMLFRKNCKKVSENYFAVSRFNLITHNITVNNEVPNTISEVYDEDKKNTISILGDVADEYIIERTVVPRIIAASANNDHVANILRSNEFLANTLLNELRYTYQGSIIIKYNPKIEVGDTITLIDSVSNTYGIFEVDSYEHSLDQRGLITSLIVKAYWSLSDPVLDYYSNEVSFKLMNQFKNAKIDYISSGENDNEDNQGKVTKIIGNYLKFIVQSPKYCSFYHKVKERLFYPSTVDSDASKFPTALPLRFYPMIKKGVAQIPDNIKYAFFKAPREKNNYYTLIAILNAHIEKTIIGGLKAFGESVISAGVFVLDILISIVTFDISEFFKPLLGITTSKAIKKTFDKVEDVDDNVMYSMNTYNPYEVKYNLMGKFDLTFGFFNVRLQNTEDLFANKSVKPTKELAGQYLNEKIRVVRKMLNDVFDCMMLVELYDGFNNDKNDNPKYNFGLTNSKGQRFTHKDFIDSVTSTTSNEGTNLFRCACLEELFHNNYGNEYGAVLLRKSKFGDTRTIPYKMVDLPHEGRKAIEVMFDVADLGIENALNSEPINEIKFIFMHNLFGDTKYKKGVNALDIRRDNVESLLKKYQLEAISDNVGVIIVGDFNLHLYKKGSKPIETSATKNTNSFMEIDDEYNFEPQINSLTTIGKDGNVSGNQYDNVLLSKNLMGKVKAKAFDYPEVDKIVVSDHIPVYVGLKKLS